MDRSPNRAMRTIAGGIALAAAGYAANAGRAWLRYGHAAAAAANETDPLLDRFMPTYEVVERHRVRIAAPAGIALDVAREQKLMGIPIVRAIFKTRELLSGSTSPSNALPTGLLAQVMALGWGVLADQHGREVVVGSATKPWEADVVFKAIPAERFAAFAEPGFVKIAWSLRADSVDADHCVFRTETRAVATDSVARAKFRRYWAFVSPGVALIRRMSVRLVKRHAERLQRVSPEGRKGLI